MSLDRFKTAQQDGATGFDTALAELQAGRKTSHWIWYVFPQLGSLGRSSTARFYGLSGIDEACDYLCDPLLRDRLGRATEAVERQLAQGESVRDVMGSEIDSFKLVSSLTLFDLAAKKLLASEARSAESDLERLSAVCAGVLAAAGKQGFPRCKGTVDSIARLEIQ